MVYSFALIKHANIRYREAAFRLGQYELISLLHSLGIDCKVLQEMAGGAAFLTFECRRLSDDEISYLSGHSSIGFMAVRNDEGAFIPLNPLPVDYLPEDLPEILKYKGKTAVPFTMMMLNVAISVSGFARSSIPVTVMDPMCGKATTCFCALQRGMNAVGMDIDQKAVSEASDYFSRYLKYHMMKHSVKRRSETIGKASVPVTEFIFSDSREHYAAQNTRSLLLSCGDASMSPAVTRRKPVHIIAADLPYGIQHAPRIGQKPESFVQLLTRMLPIWNSILAPGGALAISFNTLTLPCDTAAGLIRRSGFTLCESERFSHFRHDVEQAVVRDVLFAVKTP